MKVRVDRACLPVDLSHSHPFQPMFTTNTWLGLARTVLQITLPPDNYVHAPYNLENFSVPKTRVLIIWINFLLFGGALITWMHFIWKRRNPLETVMAIARSLFGMNLPWGA